jgi:L-asparaginase
VADRGVRRVVLLATGGTIVTKLDAETGRTRPTLGGDELVARLPLPLDGIVLETEQVMNLPSYAIGPREMGAVARAVNRVLARRGVAGAVVTHGTTTLEDTAFVTDLLLRGEKPVVFTGAMLNADQPDSDGPRNVWNAARVAASPEARSLGALVCLMGDILAARDATKFHKTAPDTFTGLEGGVLGRADPDRVTFYRRPFRRRPFRVDGPVEPVAFIAVVPGMGDGLLRAAIEQGARGIVIQGLPGSGGLPPSFVPGVEAAGRAGIPVVLTARSPLGRMPPYRAGGTGGPLAELGLIYAGNLLPNKAWDLLSVALAETNDAERLRAIFAEVAP